MHSKLKQLHRDTSQWSWYVMIIGLFVAIPAFTIVFYLFDGVGEMWGHITSYFLLDYLTNSLILLVGTGLLTFLFGVSSAWIVSQYDFPFRKILEWLLFLPLAIPSYIVAYAYVGLLGNGGSLIRFIQSLGIPLPSLDIMNVTGLIWVLSCSLFPYVYGSSRSMFQGFPASIRETADILGVSRWRYFFTAALPLASPAIIGGLFLVFMEVLNDYGAAKYYGVQTFTTGIFRTWTALEDIQSAIYLSALLVLIVFSINGLVTWQRGKRSYALKIRTSDTHKHKRKTLKGGAKVLALFLLSIPLLAGFIMPVGQLVYWGILTYEKMFTSALWEIAIQSFGIAFSAATIILLVSLVMIYFSNWSKIKEFHLFKRLATIGYVIPGAIIGIGIIRSSQSIIDFFSTTFDLRIGFLFYGSSVILVYAYLFRFLAVAFNPLEANSLKVGKKLGESSWLLGLSKLKTLIRIELPLLRSSVISAFILVFIDVMKELPLTLILKPYNVQTLAVKAYEYADDERVAEASWPALVLISVIVVLILLLDFSDKRRSVNGTNT
ncbi:MAG: iron ABC transporter permease [Bacteroidota bacterium]